MEKFYATVGIKYRDTGHPLAPQLTSTGYVVIEANNESEARVALIQRLGTDWAFIYTETPPARHHPDGEQLRIVATQGP